MNKKVIHFLFSYFFLSSFIYCYVAYVINVQYDITYRVSLFSFCYKLVSGRSKLRNAPTKKKTLVHQILLYNLPSLINYLSPSISLSFLSFVIVSFFAQFALWLYTKYCNQGIHNHQSHTFSFSPFPSPSQFRFFACRVQMSYAFNFKSKFEKGKKEKRTHLSSAAFTLVLSRLHVRFNPSFSVSRFNLYPFINIITLDIKIILSRLVQI